MDKLKDPKIIGSLVAAVVIGLGAMFANVKPVAESVCAVVAPAVSQEIECPACPGCDEPDQPDGGNDDAR